MSETINTGEGNSPAAVLNNVMGGEQGQRGINLVWILCVTRTHDSGNGRGANQVYTMNRNCHMTHDASAVIAQKQLTPRVNVPATF